MMHTNLYLFTTRLHHTNTYTCTTRRCKHTVVVRVKLSAVIVDELYDVAAHVHVVVDGCAKDQIQPAAVGDAVAGGCERKALIGELHVVLQAVLGRAGGDAVQQAEDRAWVDGHLVEVCA